MIPRIPEATLSAWQGIVDTLADVVAVPAGLIMRVAEPRTEVLLASGTPGNPYRPGNTLAWPLPADRSLSLPIRWPDQTPFGALCLLDREPNAFSDAHRRLVGQFRDLIEGQLVLVHDEARHTARTIALTREKERLVLAARAGGIGIWEMDFADNRFIWDERMHAIYGLPAATFSGILEDWVPLLAPADVPRVMREWTAAIEETSLLDTEFHILCPSGATRVVRALAQVIRRDDGMALRAVGINWDVTAEREAADAMREAKERAEAAERSKSEFLAMMSHEIRSPMNAVLGMVRLALQTDLTPKQFNYLSKIDLSAKALILILNDVLDFSKIEARKLHLEATEFTLESMLESVAAVTAVKAEEKGLEIAFAVAPDVPARVIGDPLRLGQVLINLVNNAVKFTDQGEVVVSLDVDPTADETRATLRVAVRDTGIGLKPGQVDRLFQAFTQADPHTTREYGGTGLGLAISRQLVEMMGGRIWATGEIGRGSTFAFTAQVGVPRRVSAPPSDDVVPARLGHRRVLVVDDNASAREILALMVRHFGMTTGVASSGAAALLMLKEAARAGEPFDLVLMDWRMPDMDGLEAARLIKTDPVLHGTPAVLMVTAFGREEILRRAEQLRLEGVLIKPVTESVLFNTIAEALGGGVADPDPEAASMRARRPRIEEPSWATLAGRRALIVDDNALNREVAMDFLLAAGMRVDAAVHGRDALERLRAGSQAYDVVLMDVHMPEMDGLTATREIRRQAQLSRLPIVALTAQAQTADREASLAAGMNAHLTKPIDETTLYETLSALLDTTATSRPTPSVPSSSSPPPSFATRATAATHAVGADGADERAAADVAALAWPAALPGIDLGVALNRLGGKRDRVLRLLRGFVRDFSGAPAQLAADQAAGRRESIVTIAHTVKSAAGYLGATELSEASASLEDAARHRDDEATAERVLVFRDYLDLVLRGVQAFFAEAAATPSAATVAAGGTDGETLARLIASAEPLVGQGDFAAVALLDEIGVRAAGTPMAALANTARDQFEDVELDAARATLRALRLRVAGPSAEDGA